MPEKNIGEGSTDPAFWHTFYAPDAVTWENILRHPLDGSIGRPHSQPGRFVEHKNLMSLPGIKTIYRSSIPQSSPSLYRQRWLHENKGRQCASMLKSSDSRKNGSSVFRVLEGQQPMLCGKTTAVYSAYHEIRKYSPWVKWCILFRAKYTTRRITITL